MKKSKCTESQIILKQAGGGVSVTELCCEHGMSNATFYVWRSKYGGMDASMIPEMKSLQLENARLTRMYADPSLQNKLMLLQKSSAAVSTQRDGQTSGQGVLIRLAFQDQ